MQGAFGACYAMRGDCFTHIPPNFLMEDFYISMSILKKGKKAICELKRESATKMSLTKYLKSSNERHVFP
jgi:hypothetical protein